MIMLLQELPKNVKLNVKPHQAASFGILGDKFVAYVLIVVVERLQTLALRMERHCSNALTVAKYLSDHEKVEWVEYAGLETSKYYDLAKKYTAGKPSALLTFGIKGGFDAGVEFYDKLQLFRRLVNIGDAKSLAAHPASTTHRQLTDAELEKAGVTSDMIRLCVGIEDIDDILADLGQALG